MKITILDLLTVKDFKSTFVHIWTNQSRKVYKMDQYNNEIELSYVTVKPLGIVFGVYATVNNNTHTIGQTLIDASKLNTDHFLIANVLDPSSPVPKTGVLHLQFENCKRTQPLPFNTHNITTLHRAAESNLNWIQPYSKNGLPPCIPYLKPMHSPYYTSNTGIQLPSGAFLLDTGNRSASTNHLRIALACMGLTPEYFVKHTKSFNHFQEDTQNVLLAMCKALTMHATQCFSYVADVQYDATRVYSTDRWESSRYVGDCEDCSKEIYTQIQEWIRSTSLDPLTLAMQKMLSFYVPVLVQGCVKINASYKNHIWSALISKHAFYKNDKHTYMPTLLLEGTRPTYPLYKKKTFSFYKYAVACMANEEPGVLDYTYVTDKSYGVSFENWWKGNYEMRPSCKHNEPTLKLINKVISYDKPISTLNLKSVLKQYGTVRTYDIHKTISYRITSLQDKKHLETIERMKDKDTCMNIINHGICYWVEWVIHKEHKPTLFIL